MTQTAQKQRFQQSIVRDLKRYYRKNPDASDFQTSRDLKIHPATVKKYKPVVQKSRSTKAG